jgi:glycosyltransferase involved in cell wall biosynthesis
LIDTAREAIEPEISQLAQYPVIVSWGRLSDEKGYQHLLKVYARVKQTVQDAKLLLIGDGPMLEELASDAERLGFCVGRMPADALASDLILLGYRKSPIRYAKIAKVFVLSSCAEGFPNAVVEAMAAGVPVVGANCPWGVRSALSLVSTDVSTPYPTQIPTRVDFGVLMPRIDLHDYEEAWALELVQALSGGHDFDEYRRKGPLRAMEFDESRTAPKWLELVESLTTSSAGAAR